MHWPGKCHNFVIDHLITVKLISMETQRRKVELRSGGSTELLIWFIIVVAFIFWAISTRATNYDVDLTTKTNGIIPHIQNMVKTTNDASGIIIHGQVSRNGSSIVTRHHISRHRSFR